MITGAFSIFSRWYFRGRNLVYVAPALSTGRTESIIGGPLRSAGEPICRAFFKSGIGSVGGPCLEQPNRRQKAKGKRQKAKMLKFLFKITFLGDFFFSVNFGLLL